MIQIALLVITSGVMTTRNDTIPGDHADALAKLISEVADPVGDAQVFLIRPRAGRRALCLSRQVPAGRVQEVVDLLEGTPNPTSAEPAR